MPELSSNLEVDRYRMALQGQKGGLWDLDLNGSRFYVSPEFWRWVGIKEGNRPVSLTGLLGIIDEADRGKFTELFNTPFNGPHRPYECEFRVLTGGDAPVWCSSAGLIIYDAEASPNRLVGLTRDISARKKMERDLEGSEELLRESQRLARVGGWSLDFKTEKVIWSEQVFEMFGLPRADEAPSLSEQHRLFSPKSWSALNECIEKSRVTKEAYEMELKVERNDGSEGWILSHGEPVQDHKGEIIGLHGVARDITKEKLFREQLAEQAALIDQAPVAFVLQDLEHQIVFWSKGAERIFGLEVTDAVGRNWLDLAGLAPALRTDASEQLAQTGAWQVLIETKNKAGEDIAIESRWTLLRDDEGEPKSILTIGSDVSETKEVEAQLMRAQRMESIGMLAGGIAHDLNNVLAPILMGMTVLRRKLADDPRGLSIIESIEKSANRGAALVKQVLSFAREVEPSDSVVQIKHLIHDIESVTENTFPKNIEFEFDIEAKPWPVTGDATHLHQVLLNLCVNARDAMPEGGTLTVKARNQHIDRQFAAMDDAVEPGHYVCLEVSDSGMGMTPEVQAQIFDPFFTTKEEGKGTGIGLSTVKSIVENLAGALTVESKPGRGSTFRVFFPAQVQASSKSAADSAPIKTGNGELILLVEDEASVLNITRQTLEAFGYRVLTAKDGAQAIGHYVKNRDEIALVLTDSIMPVMGGFALISAIHEIDPEAKVMVTSGNSSDESDTRQAAESGSGFLPKPYSAEQLLEKVSSILEA